MRIITISREFGSGGRELGKRLADILGFDYYDREIITALAEKHDMSEEYLESVLENNFWQTVPLTYHHSFEGIPHFPAINTSLLIEQTKLLKEIAKAGKDCIIVGRNADYILNEYNPLNLFVCSSMEEKIKRCMERENDGEVLTEKKLRRKILQIDKNRAKTRDIISGKRWGYRGTYHLTVNTEGWEIKELAPVIANYATAWFQKAKKD